MDKNFLAKSDKLYEWNKVKISFHNKPNRKKSFRESDVQWVACGENVGTEINGKGKVYTRPVYVLRKLDARSFVGIPLTTQKKTGTWYVQLNFQGKEIRAVISQIRTFSTKRMYERIGQLDEQDVNRIKRALRELLKL